LCPQLAGVKWGPGAGKAVEVETVPGGLIMPEDLSSGTDNSFQYC
jgi:hypothetical protein